MHKLSFRYKLSASACSALFSLFIRPHGGMIRPDTVNHVWSSLCVYALEENFTFWASISIKIMSHCDCTLNLQDICPSVSCKARSCALEFVFRVLTKLNTAFWSSLCVFCEWLIKCNTIELLLVLLFGVRNMYIGMLV